MLKLNLESLGVTEEALTQSILNELGLTKEQAVKALAERLGVPLKEDGTSVSTGDSVLTTQGESVAQVLTPAEINTLREAAAISSRIFS
jgi:hypothetical protein